MSSPAGWVSRRAVLRAAATFGLAVAATAACSEPEVRPAGSPAAAFLAREKYFIAHRGAADEAPEHTLAAYLRIVDRGAEAVEISVHSTKDGVMVCHHDPTLKRTSAGFAGAIAELSYTELSAHKIDMTQVVGPKWGKQDIPRLEDVLDRIGTRAILFIEPKDAASVAGVVKAVVSRELQGTTVYKQYYKARSEQAARAAGIPVWNYYDVETPVSDVAALGATSDAIGADVNADPIDDTSVALLTAALATGKPVIGYAVHRREQVDDLARRGVRGFMCSSWSYLAQPMTPIKDDAFGTGLAAPGDLPPGYNNPDAIAVWHDDGSRGLVNPLITQSLSMGSLCPTPPTPHRISLELAFDALPSDKGQHAGLVIGRSTDAPYRFGVAGPSEGQLVILRANGLLELRLVADDNGPTIRVTSAVGPPVVPGRWEQLTIDVEAQDIVVTRTAPGSASVSARAPRTALGGYFVLTRNFASAAGVRFRKITVSET